jgi:hypothetical protein
MVSQLELKSAGERRMSILSELLEEPGIISILIVLLFVDCSVS